MSEEDEKEKIFLISVSLGANGQLIFKSTDDVTNWLGSETELWQWLSSVARTDNAIGQAWQKISQALTQIRKVNTETINSVNTPHYDAKYEALTNLIKGLSDDSVMILSQNPKAKFIEQLRAEQGERIAAYCVALFLNCGVTANNPEAIQGTVAAVLYIRGIKDSAQSERESLAELIKHFGEESAKYLETYNELAKDYASLADVLGKTIDTGKDKFSTEIENAQSSLMNMMEESESKLESFEALTKKEWEDIKQSFTDQMALQAPVDYWVNQQFWHRIKSMGYAVASIAWVSASVVALFYATYMMLSTEYEYNSGAITTFLGIPLWHLVVFMIFASVAIWVARILVRLLLSEVHLTTDAGERVVMVKTYLALLKEGQGPEAKDRSLILQTLFRPSSYGVISEESHPVLPVEWLQKIINK